MTTRLKGEPDDSTQLGQNLCAYYYNIIAAKWTVRHKQNANSPHKERLDVVIEI